MITTRRLAVLWLFALSCYGQGLEFIKSHYTKYEFQIPMRDGKHLFTSVYVPKDTHEKFPIMLSRTPYSVSPYGVENYKTALGPSAVSTRRRPNVQATLPMTAQPALSSAVSSLSMVSVSGSRPTN